MIQELTTTQTTHELTPVTLSELQQQREQLEHEQRVTALKEYENASSK